jgi:recombination protein RecA
MAKKEKEIPQERSMGFNEMLKTLTKQHNEISLDSAQFGEENLGSAVKYWIPTGSIALDTIISNKAEYGGWPCGRITEIYGEQAYGKTSLCFQGMANCQAAGGLVIFYDIELAASEELMRGYGIKIEEILYSNLSTVEEIFQSLENNLTLIANNPLMRDKPVMVVIDSLAAMKSKKLEEGTYDYNMNTQGEFAKILGSGLKRSLEFLSAANAALIVVNQQRDKIGSFVPGKTQPGGNAMKFYATLRCVLLGKKYLTSKEDITGDEIPYGAEVTVRTDKNKLGPPIRSVEMKLVFTKGIDETDEWVTYLDRIGVTEGKGWRTITDKFPVKEYVGKKFQRGNFLELLEEAPFYDGCVKVIKQGFVKRIDDVMLKQEQENAAKIEE